MKDVWTTSVSKKTIDEAPKAYKSAKQLLADVEDAMGVLINFLINLRGE
ncbi:Undefined function [Listeria monocytogenes N53-1]|nr:Undefined function [Listeria monocytogenes N53-1]